MYYHPPQLLLALSSFILTSHAVNIATRFRVETGTGPVTRSPGTTGTYGGSCNGINADLNAIYTEAIDMAQYALYSLNNYGTMPTVRATVQTFFGIRPVSDTGNTVDASQSALFNYVKSIYQDIITDANNVATGNTPGFFCDDSWRWKTSMVYSLTTGDMTSVTLSEQTGGGMTTANWSPLFRDYTGAGAACTGTTLAFTSYGSTASITMCPYSWNYPRKKDSLSTWHNGAAALAEGTPLISALSTPSTLLHELAHLTTAGAVTDKFVTINGVRATAYGPEKVAALSLISPTDSVRNADSYRWFAIAMYLDAYDWSRTINGRSVAAVITARSRNSTLVDVPSSTLGDDDAEDDGLGLKRTNLFWRRLFGWKGRR